jgi:hypothetical protein
MENDTAIDGGNIFGDDLAERMFPGGAASVNGNQKMMMLKILFAQTRLAIDR